MIFINNKLNSDLIAPCGFYCGSCPSYLSGKCKGCYNNETDKCFTYDCVLKKDINFCGECKDFPCNYIINNEKATLISKKWLKWKKQQYK
ncbi:DUF3795 domain-containing protein [Halothermothrix orenii]|uniref:DUF3795 domain-containing protein n=1 Tax=Halothermothrix orenii TaxID=31909 RepID=UPI0014387F72